MQIKQDIFPIVKKIVDRHDLRGLLKMDAPEDEYDGESRKIAGGLRACQDIMDVQKLIWAVFRDSFGADLPEHEDMKEYEPIAKEIFNAVKNIGS